MALPPSSPTAIMSVSEVENVNPTIVDSIRDATTIRGCSIVIVGSSRHQKTFSFSVKRKAATRYYCQRCEKVARDFRTRGHSFRVKTPSIKRLDDGTFENDIFEFEHVCVNVEKQLTDMRFRIANITPDMHLSYFEIPGFTNLVLRHISPPPSFLMLFADKVTLQAFHDADDIVMDETKFKAIEGQFLYFGHAVYHQLPEKAASYMAFAFLMGDASADSFTEAFKQLALQLDVEFPGWKERRRRFHINGPKNGVLDALRTVFPEDSVIFPHHFVQTEVIRLCKSRFWTLLVHQTFVYFLAELIGSNFLPLDLQQAFLNTLFLPENLPALPENQMPSVRGFVQHYEDDWLTIRACINQFNNHGPRMLRIEHVAHNRNHLCGAPLYDTLPEVVQMLRRMFSAAAIDFKEHEEGTIFPQRRKTHQVNEMKVAQSIEVLQGVLNAGITPDFDNLRAYCRHQYYNFNEGGNNLLQHADVVWVPPQVESLPVPTVDWTVLTVVPEGVASESGSSVDASGLSGQDHHADARSPVTGCQTGTKMEIRSARRKRPY
uniref:MULE domain-containing protein n=1 Tax=Panagrellus redivivus TaxID=6233 RepID=A0A7E4UZL3_PANRE